MTIGAALYQRTCWLRFTLRVAEPTFDKDLNVVGAHDHAPNRWSSTSHCADIDCYGAGAPPVYFGGGGKLASDLTWPRLLRRWDGSAAPAGAQVGPAVSAARRAASTARWEPGVRPVRTDRFGLTEMERLTIWKQSTLAASRASEHIAASVEGDPAGAADAAWAASDFLAATGRVVEDRRGGPLTEAAQSCDQAARELHGKVPALTAAGTGLRAAGRLLLSAGCCCRRRSRSPVRASSCLR